MDDMFGLGTFKRNKLKVVLSTCKASNRRQLGFFLTKSQIPEIDIQRLSISFDENVFI